MIAHSSSGLLYSPFTASLLIYRASTNEEMNPLQIPEVIITGRSTPEYPRPGTTSPPLRLNLISSVARLLNARLKNKKNMNDDSHAENKMPVNTWPTITRRSEEHTSELQS